MCPGSVHTFTPARAAIEDARPANLAVADERGVPTFRGHASFGDQVGEALEGFAPSLVLARPGTPAAWFAARSASSCRPCRRTSRGDELVAGQVSRIAVKTMRSFRTISRYTRGTDVLAVGPRIT